MTEQTEQTRKEKIRDNIVTVFVIIVLAITVLGAFGMLAIAIFPQILSHFLNG
jgi:nitrate reductase NapE component